MELVSRLREDYASVFRRWPMIRLMALKDLRNNIVDTALGRAWMLIEPLGQMLIYYFIVVVVFQAGSRFGVNPFVFIMMGLTHYVFLNKATSIASNSFLTRRAILMQVKIEPLVFLWVDMFKACADLAVALVLYSVFYLALGPGGTWNLLWYPVLLSVLLMVSYSLSLLFATLMVVVRDVGKIRGILMRLMMYLSPVIYTVEFVPETYRAIYLYNPIACLFALFQWCLFDATFPPIGPVVSMAVCFGILAAAAHAAYDSLEPKFTKVM